MSVQQPNLVKLSNDQQYKEIGTFLNSIDYTREEKVKLILTKNKNETPLAKESNSFLAMCLYHYRECGYVPLELALRAIKILGEKNLGLPNCLFHVKRLMTGGRPMEEKVRLLQVVVEELDDLKHTEAMASLLVQAVLCKCYSLVHVLLKSKSGKQSVLMKHDVITKHCFDRTRSTTAIQPCNYEKYQNMEPLDRNIWNFHSATILEIALHKKANVKIVKELVKVGGKHLLSLSKRSLLQGAILECNNQDAYEIMKYILGVGGKNLVMVNKSWNINDDKSINIFQFLSIHQRLLFDPKCHNDDALKRVHKIMDLLINYGGKDAIVQKNTSGGSILHDFQYFGHGRFFDLVDRIVNFRGMELLRVQDKNGDSILHVLARCQQKGSFQSAKTYWEFLAKKELVMVQNVKGQTALHLACENNATIGIEVMLAQGCKDLAWKQDNEGNTALHYLKQEGTNFASLKLIVHFGGTKLLHCRNNKKEKSLNPFLIEAIEFQPDKKKLQASVTELEKKVDDLEHNHANHISWIKELKEFEQSQRDTNQKQKEQIKELQDSAKEKEIELENFKAKYESSKAYEIALSEQPSEMKEVKCLQNSSNKQEKENKDQRQLNGSSSNVLKTSKRSRMYLDDNQSIASKRRKQVTDTHDIRDLKVLQQEINKLRMENRDLTNDLKREKLSYVKALKRLEAARKKV